jgi:hypothetical protein
VFSLFLFFSNEMPQSRDYKKPTTTFFLVCFSFWPNYFILSLLSPHSPTTKFKQNALGFVDPVRVDVFKSDSPKFLLHVGR